MALGRISSGSLNRVVTLQQPTKTQDGSGQRVHTYADATAITPAARRARVRMLNGRESVQADALTVEANFEVTFRYIPDPLPARQTIAGTTNFAADDTVTVDTKVYTFKAVPALDGEVDIGVDLSTSMTNLLAAINLDVPIGGKYGDAMTIHPTVTATSTATVKLYAASKIYGTGGNGIASTVGGGNTGNSVWAGATLTGGAATGGHLTEDYRLSIDDGDSLEIVSVQNAERQAMTVCQCKRTT